jgi:hypothetical protein
MMTKVFFLLLPLLNASPALAAAPGEFAKKLVELRAEVEEAGNGYEESLQKRKTALEPLQSRHSELETQIAKEELRQAQLREKLKATRPGLCERSCTRSEEWRALDAWAGKLSAYVEAAIPFRQKERREKVKALAERIRQKRESPVMVAADLWAATEKELGLTRNVEYRISKLPLASGEAELEIARLGMVHLLYRRPGGAAGFSSRKNGKWELVATRSPAETEAVDRLLSRLKAKSTNGWYEIPGLDSIPREEQE